MVILSPSSGLRSREPQENRADRSLRRGPGSSRSLQNTSPVRGPLNLVQILFGNLMFSFSQLPVISSYTSVYPPKIIIAKELFTHTSNCMGVNLSHNVPQICTTCTSAVPYRGRCPPSHEPTWIVAVCSMVSAQTFRHQPVMFNNPSHHTMSRPS